MRAEIADWDGRVVVAHTKATAKAAQPVAKHGEVGNGRGRGDNVTSTERGNTAAYLAARIKRDAPEIAARVEAGEFRSMRAAAKAAQPVAKHGGDRTKVDEQGSDRTLKRGETSAYLAAPFV